MTFTFVPGVDAPGDPGPDAVWFVFNGERLLARTGGAAADLLRGADVDALRFVPAAALYLGTLDGAACYVGEVARPETLPDGWTWGTLRGLAARSDAALFALAGRAAQIREWDRTHRYCGRCGALTEPAPGERARRCPACGLLSYPRIAPAVIVRVRRGDSLLLARAHNFPGAFYSVLAGFVEPGETLEETVVREVAEEVGIQVTDIRYFGSQPWPFPHSLMIGFTATYAGGEIAVDGREIADAQWFTRATLPQLPPPFSIARTLIESFLAEVGE